MNALLQNGLVAVVVITAFAYSAWVLMPAHWRRALARLWGRQELAAAGGCGGCGGCSPGPAKAKLEPQAVAEAVITVHRRPKPPGHPATAGQHPSKR